MSLEMPEILTGPRMLRARSLIGNSMHVDVLCSLFREVLRHLQ
jgi:hypothetical protein